MTERYLEFPSEKNLGEECEFWDTGCGFPKAEMMGRLSCEGIIDPVCIYLLEGRRIEGFDLTEAQVLKLKMTPPDPNGPNHYIPAGKPLEL